MICSLLALALACGAPAGAAPPAHAAAKAHPCKHASKERCLRKRVERRLPFGPSSIWNDRLRRSTPVSPRSGTYASTLQASVGRYGAWVNTTQWSTPVYSVDRGQPPVRVSLDHTFGYQPELQAALGQVPIPADARPSADSDAHLVVYQRSTETMWELWGARRNADGWHARSGGRMNDLSSAPGYFPRAQGWGATATGLPMLGGLIRIRELRAGLIPHALSIAIPQARAGLFASPAQHTDGVSLSPSAIPEGTRFRIDPDLDLSKLPMSPFTRTIARASQRYGIYVTDQAADVSFMAEDPTPTGRNPYPARFFGGKHPDELLQQFPWGALEVVDAPLHCCG